MHESLPKVYLIPPLGVGVLGVLTSMHGPGRFAGAPGSGAHVYGTRRTTTSLYGSSAFVQRFGAYIPSHCHVRCLFVSYAL